jgi:hypothetical protein
MLKRAVKVSLALLRATDGDLIIRSRRIVKKMTGNASYPQPNPALGLVATAADAFEQACQEAIGGGEEETVAKNAARAALISLLRQLSYYVQLACDGNQAILVSSGFQATKDPQPAGTLPAAGNVRVSHTGISGQFALTCDAVANAAVYQVQSATAPDGPWEDEGGFTSTRITLDGFKPGTVYWFTLYAVGAAGNGATSSPLSLMAL